jgi:hypothetical protein
VLERAKKNDEYQDRVIAIAWCEVDEHEGETEIGSLAGLSWL